MLRGSRPRGFHIALLDRYLLQGLEYRVHCGDPLDVFLGIEVLGQAPLRTLFCPVEPSRHYLGSSQVPMAAEVDVLDHGVGALTIV